MKFKLKYVKNVDNYAYVGIANPIMILLLTVLFTLY